VGFAQPETVGGVLEVMGKYDAHGSRRMCMRPFYVPLCPWIPPADAQGCATCQGDPIARPAVRRTSAIGHAVPGMDGSPFGWARVKREPDVVP
jgi:hypothetical protein